MLLDNKREKTIDNHKNIFKLYKELKTILPIGYIKTRVSQGQRYSIQKQSILNKLEKEKNKEIISPSKITQNLFYNKNIYLFPDENEKKHFLTKIKKLNNPPKQLSLKIINNDSDIINTTENTLNNNINNINIINNDLSNSINLNFQLEKDLFTDRYNSNRTFRSSTINNCFMKNNIFLPSITSRLKNNKPRYNRQSHGFLLKGLGKKFFKDLEYNEKHANKCTKIDEEIMTKNNKMYETIKLIKNNNNNDDNNDEYNDGIRYMSNDKKKFKINIHNGIKSKFKKFLSQNNLKAKDLKITRIKKVKILNN